MVNKMFDVNNIRKDFKILNQKENKLVYLDSASTTQKPSCVIDTLVNYYENYNANIHRGAYKLAEEATSAYESVREKVKTFFSVSKEEQVVFTRNTTESINLLAYTLGQSVLNDGDEVLLTEMEHHSNIIPWFIQKEKKNITIAI